MAKLSPEQVTAELKRKAIAGYTIDQVSPENRGAYEGILRSNAIKNMATSYNTPELKFNDQEYKVNTIGAGSSGINNLATTKQTAINNMLNSSVSDVESERALAQQGFEGSQKDIDERTYKNMKRDRVAGSMRGITHSQQLLAMEERSMRQGDKLHAENMSNRDIKLEDIQRRIGVLRANAGKELSNVEVERQSSLMGLEKEAGVRAEDLKMKYDESNRASKQWAMSQALDDMRAKESREYSTAERIASEDFTLTRDNIQNTFTEYMTKLGFSHDVKMKGIDYTNQVAFLGLSTSAQMSIMNHADKLDQAGIEREIKQGWADNARKNIIAMAELDPDFMAKLGGQGKFESKADLAKLDLYLDAFGYEEDVKAHIVGVIGKEYFNDQVVVDTKGIRKPISQIFKEYLFGTDEAMQKAIKEQKEWNEKKNKISGSNFGSAFKLSFDFGKTYKGGGVHKGIDFAAPNGTPIKAQVSGTVISAKSEGKYGNLVTIKDDNGYYHLYGHMSAMLAKPGTKISAGSIIGKVGSTGNSTGNHVHYEVRKTAKFGTHIDPTSFLL